MRCIIFSDIHGNIHAFRAFLEKIRKQKYDKIFFLGDFVGYYYNPNEIIEHCIDLGVTCLLGNHDSYFLRMLNAELDQEELVRKYGNSYRQARETMTQASIDFLLSLKPSLNFNISGRNVLLCHGSPINPLEGRIYPDTDLSVFTRGGNFDYIICGHTHHKISRKYENTWFLNPGSLGQQRDGKGCSYLSIDFFVDTWTIDTVDYDIGALEAQVDRYDMGAERLKSVLRRPPPF